MLIDTSVYRPILAWIFVVVFFATVARTSSANLILYIDDPSTGSGTATYEVVLMDGKYKGYVIQQSDTTFSALWNHVVTADDVDTTTDLYNPVADGEINVSSSGLVDINNRFADFDFSGELTAYTNVDSLGGRELHTKASVEGFSQTRKELKFAATYNFEFGRPGWYFWHTAGGRATDGSGDVGDPSIILGENDIPAMTTFGGVSNSDQDFTLDKFYGGTPSVTFPDSGDYALEDPPGDGNVYLSGVNAGTYTMTANFTVYLSANQKLQFQSTTYAITPEPASIAVWVIGGLVMTRRKVYSVAARIKSSIS